MLKVPGFFRSIYLILFVIVIVIIASIKHRLLYVYHYATSIKEGLSLSALKFLYILIPILGLYNFIGISVFFRVWHIFIFIFVVYFFTNTWFYFYNIYKYSKYTTSVQRFWKRTYMLFWLIEFFLFSIFIYFYFIIPSEGYYMYSSGTNNMVSPNLTTYNNHLYSLITLSCIVSNIVIFFRKFNTTVVYALWLVILYVYSSITIYEFFKLRDSIIVMVNLDVSNIELFTNNYFLNDGFGSITNLDLNSLSDNSESYRTSTYINIIISILKFWHIVFIYTIFLFTSIQFINTNLISYDSLSLNAQNANYLFIFSSLYYVFILGSVVSILFENPYQTNLFTNNYYMGLMYELNTTFIL